MIMTPEQCRRKLAALPDEIFACYTLWHRHSETPVYVGTAKSPSRIRSHLQKDAKRDGNLGKLIINRPFFDYVMGQPVGWLGISFDLFQTQSDARDAERDRISRYGMLPNGSLFNRRVSG